MLVKPCRCPRGGPEKQALTVFLPFRGVASKTGLSFFLFYYFADTSLIFSKQKGDPSWDLSQHSYQHFEM